jgi:tetratricopeptide (TPR) repeat protein
VPVTRARLPLHRRPSMRSWVTSSYDKAVAIAPGDALILLNRREAAMSCFNRALAIDPKNAHALDNRGTLLTGLRRYQEASADYERALAIEPDRRYLRGRLFQSRLYCCDWRSIGEHHAAIAAELNTGKCFVEPMVGAIFCQSATVAMFANLDRQ